ncbi:uncharacterized protein K489DRAFT_327617, partial [Dissoconium aciculare CBS 342.82]|uniref:Uncharacterized protein n=1 Tax=Dissoconium aciculare CBS 342.82 TaxID=1314786 RepID=A0A6J3LRK1_9PEZI
TYGHRQLRTRDPVRSPIFKQLTARLVLRWVTTWESLVLYVLHLFALSALGKHLCSSVRSPMVSQNGTSFAYMSIVHFRDAAIYRILPSWFVRTLLSW